MSTTELMEQIKALPVEKQREVESFVQGLLKNGQSQTVSTAGKSFDEASASVFSKHEKLLGELAK